MEADEEKRAELKQQSLKRYLSDMEKFWRDYYHKLSEESLLFGPIKPRWFEGDCSVPGRLGKWLLDADLAKAACAIHDWCYLLIPILYKYQSPLWNLKLQVADAELRWNLTKMRKKRWYGKLWGYVYYVGVRIGGRRAVERNPEIHPRRPATPDQLLETIGCARRFNDGYLTERSREVFTIMARAYDMDIRKELKR